MTDARESEELSAVRVGVMPDAVDTDDVSELPEVRAARSLGWEPGHEAPGYRRLPTDHPLIGTTGERIAA